MSGNCHKHNIPLETDTDECGRCDGFGFEDDELDGRQRCFWCNGTGKVEVTWCDACHDEECDD